MKIYLAGPLFSSAERTFNKKLASKLEESGYEVFLPQELTQSNEVDAKELYRLFDILIKEVSKADILVAILDGADTDSGTCIEMGYAFGINKPIIGVRTDFRNLEVNGVNLMVLKVCNKFLLFKEKHVLIEDLSKRIIETAKSILKVEGTKILNRNNVSA